ncbi:ribonuclease H-like domain-containing protein [Rhizophagus clarus]|uniref:Ribonuclease H-like domain-containing protein n=1 Tax=Rhizophagus clarus TaxID=94130 RepID=A0A8H3KX10_9GLOM|nr:ribonuclease H-like domain-containing protein [Rhizophagus clarus]
MLKGNQFAALPGNFTFEPIRMINEIIQDVKENNKELWLLSQDLGKAYNRINIFMLEKIKQRKLGYTLEVPKIALNKFYGEDTSKETEQFTVSSTDSFYKLNDIQVNKEKSELLVRYKQGRYRLKLKSHEPVTLKFGSNSIFIIPVFLRSSIRILGVHFDERNTFQSIIKRINDEINELQHKYTRKKITDKYMIYIFNSVIIPKIECWSQVKVLTKKFMDKVMNQFLSTFKKKLRLSITTPNEIFFNKIYNIKNISDNQDQAKITNILIQINDASVLEQILSDDGLLLSINEIRDKFNIPNILALKWYRKVIMALNTNKDILSSINRIYNTNHINCPITTQQFSRESEADRIRKNYTSKPILLNTDNYPNYYVGTPKKYVDFDTNFFTLEHYNVESVNSNNKLEISHCQGCNNTTSTYIPLRPRRDQLQESFCNIECNIFNTSILYMGQCTTVTRDKHHLISVDLNSHLHQAINSTLFTISPQTNRNTRINITCKSYNIDKQLLQYFEFNSKLKALYTIQQHLKKEDTLSFYTDGSLINANTQAASMTASFIHVSDTNNITHLFTTTIENWPSSFRAELFTILLLLIVSPYGCRVDINTDSQNSINIIQHIYNNPTFSVRDYFRLPNNNIVINNIISIIKAKNLTLRFNKVKAHNNDYFNKRIDQECKIAHYDSTPAFVIKQQYFDNIQFIPQWGSILIERKLRKFITDNIIEGFVPTTLVEWLQKYTTATQHRNLLIKAFDKLCEDSLELWKSRCEAFASIEHMCGITQYMKRSILYNTKYKESFTSYYNINSFFDFSSFNIEYIEYINLLIRFNVAYIDLFTIMLGITFP